MILHTGLTSVYVTSVYIASKTICMYVYIGDGIWHAVQERRRRCSKPVITDIIDGKNYRRLCEPGQFLNNPAHISFIFNTDGALLYSSLGVSLWPVFLAINELPSPDRCVQEFIFSYGRCYFNTQCSGFRPKELGSEGNS